MDAHVLGTSRALAIEFTGDIGDFVARCRRTRSRALDHGLVVALVTSDPDQDAMLAKLGTIVQVAGEERLQTFYTRYANAAEWIRTHDPGRGHPVHIDLELARSEDPLSPEDDVLLRRAFGDLNAITVRTLTSGLSGARVLAVQCPRSRQPLPYLAKLDARERILQELAQFQDVVRDFVPFNHRPNLQPERTLYGSTRGVLVEDFLERASPLTTVLKAGTPSVFIASLFDSALRGWRLAARVRRDNPSPVFRELKVLRRSPELDDAAREATARHRCEMSADDLYAALEALPPFPFAECHIHGDLHPGNVFVSAGSSDPVLIDFYKASYGPASADPACLEVDLVFKAAAISSRARIARLYSFPLRSVPAAAREPGLEWLWESLRSIRASGHATEPAEHGYVFATISYLLRYASYPNPLKRRALAFWAASRLARHLRDALRERRR